MIKSKFTNTNIRSGVWAILYLFFPSAVFILMRVAKAISTRECICGFLAGTIANIGLVSVLGKTNDSPLQMFIELLLVMSMYLIFIWLYWAGLRGNIWTEQAKKSWKFGGWFFGIFIFVALVVTILNFHMNTL